MSKYVATKFRKHPLSFMRGGCIIVVSFLNGESFIYDKIKYPLQYITAIIEKSGKFVNEIYVDNELHWSIKDQATPKPRKLVPVVQYQQRKAA